LAPQFAAGGFARQTIEPRHFAGANRHSFGFSADNEAMLVERRAIQPGITPAH
jgi:hypothetical protein